MQREKKNRKEISTAQISKMLMLEFQNAQVGKVLQSTITSEERRDLAAGIQMLLLVSSSIEQNENELNRIQDMNLCPRKAVQEMLYIPNCSISVSYINSIINYLFPHQNSYYNSSSYKSETLKLTQSMEKQKIKNKITPYCIT